MRRSFTLPNGGHSGGSENLFALSLSPSAMRQAIYSNESVSLWVVHWPEKQSVCSIEVLKKGNWLRALQKYMWVNRCQW